MAESMNVLPCEIRITNKPVIRTNREGIYW